MLQITDKTTIKELREYAVEKNIDLGNARKRQDIIDVISAATEGKESVAIGRVLFASRALMKGEDVDAVHAALIDNGLMVGKDKEKGIYGAKTAVAVRFFQSKNSLIVSGKVDKFTAQALGLVWEG